MHETPPALVVAAVIIFAPVGSRRQELSREVTETELELGAVEASLGRSTGCVAIRLENLPDTLPCHRFRRGAGAWAHDGRRRLRYAGDDLGVGGATGVIEVGESGGAAAVDRLDESAQTGDDVVSVDAELARVLLAPCVHVHRLDDDQPGATDNATPIVLDVGRRDATVATAEGGFDWCESESIGQGDRTDLQVGESELVHDLWFLSARDWFQTAFSESDSTMVCSFFIVSR